jgi:DNA-binding response OmpR family regulator
MAKVLIVDDQPYFRELLSKELILEGYQVRIVGDAESVREHLQLLLPDPVLLHYF